MQLLRASSSEGDATLDLSVMTLGSSAGDGGVRHGALLMEFAEAVIGEDADALPVVRDRICTQLGGEAMIDAAGVIGLFNAIDRIADATGAPLEEAKAAASADVRESIGINDFRRRREALDQC